MLEQSSNGQPGGLISSYDNKTKLRNALIALVSILTLAACGAPAAPVATATPIPEPTDTPVPTAIPEPTFTPTPDVVDIGATGRCQDDVMVSQNLILEGMILDLSQGLFTVALEGDTYYQIPFFREEAIEMLYVYIREGSGPNTIAPVPDNFKPGDIMFTIDDGDLLASISSVLEVSGVRIEAPTEEIAQAMGTHCHVRADRFVVAGQ